jgi:hypothetical protein
VVVIANAGQHDKVGIKGYFGSAGPQLVSSKILKPGFRAFNGEHRPSCSIRVPEHCGLAASRHK